MTFFALLKRYRFKISLAFFCIVLANLSALVLPWFLKVLLDEVLLPRRNVPVAGILWLLVATVALKALLEYIGSYLGLEIAERAVADLRGKIYDHLLSLSVLDVEDFSTGELISRVVSDTEAVKRFLFSGVLDFFYSALSAAFVLGVLFCVDMKFATIAAVVLPLFLAVYSGMNGKLKQGYTLLRRNHADLSGRLGEVFRGVRTVHAFGRREHEVGKFSVKQGEILRTAFKNHSGDTWFFVTAEFLSSLGLIALLGYGVQQITSGKMTVGTLMAFYTYLGFLFLPLLKMTAAGATYQEARASMERIQEVLSRAPAPKEPKTPMILQKMPGHVQFQNVTFAYPGSRSVLSGIDFEVEPGEWVAFVGPSGSGKTTLACLLARLLDPLSGRVLVDGCDIRLFSLEDYRCRVAVVHQNDFLFKDTIASNIRYADLQASDEAVMAAAGVADIHSFIAGLPDGYHTAVGEGGVKLSGGQRQRIALARALLKNPAILILDEPLSAVDPTSARKITETMRKIRGRQTTLVIAHRISTPSYVDRIITMNEGKIDVWPSRRRSATQSYAV